MYYVIECFVEEKKQWYPLGTFFAMDSILPEQEIWATGIVAFSTYEQGMSCYNLMKQDVTKQYRLKPYARIEGD